MMTMIRTSFEAKARGLGEKKDAGLSLCPFPKGINDEQTYGQNFMNVTPLLIPQVLNQ